MRRITAVAEDFVRDGTTATDMVGNVFDARHCASTIRRVHAGDFQGNAMPGLEHIGRAENLDLVFDHLPRRHRLYRCASELMKGFPGG